MMKYYSMKEYHTRKGGSRHEGQDQPEGRQEDGRFEPVLDFWLAIGLIGKGVLLMKVRTNLKAGCYAEDEARL